MVISRVITIRVTLFRAVITLTLLITYLLSPLPLQVNPKALESSNRFRVAGQGLP